MNQLKSDLTWSPLNSTCKLTSTFQCLLSSHVLSYVATINQLAFSTSSLEVFSPQIQSTWSIFSIFLVIVCNSFTNYFVYDLGYWFPRLQDEFLHHVPTLLKISSPFFQPQPALQTNVCIMANLHFKNQFLHQLTSIV